MAEICCIFCAAKTKLLSHIFILFCVFYQVEDSDNPDNPNMPLTVILLQNGSQVRLHRKQELVKNYHHHLVTRCFLLEI